MHDSDSLADADAPLDGSERGCKLCLSCGVAWFADGTITVTNGDEDRRDLPGLRERRAVRRNRWSLEQCQTGTVGMVPGRVEVDPQAHLRPDSALSVLFGRASVLRRLGGGPQRSCPGPLSANHGRPEDPHSP